MRSLICVGIEQKGYRVYDVENKEFFVLDEKSFLKYKLSESSNSLFVSDANLVYVCKINKHSGETDYIITDKGNLVIEVVKGSVKRNFSIKATKNLDLVDILRLNYHNYSCIESKIKVDMKSMFDYDTNVSSERFSFSDENYLYGCIKLKFKSLIYSKFSLNFKYNIALVENELKIMFIFRDDNLVLLALDETNCTIGVELHPTEG